MRCHPEKYAAQAAALVATKIGAKHANSALLLKAYPVRPQQQAADMRTRAVTNRNWNKRRTMAPVAATGGQVTSREKAQRKMAAQASAAKRRRARPQASGGNNKRAMLLRRLKQKMDNGEPIVAPANLYDRAIKRAKDGKMNVTEKNGTANITLNDGRVMTLKRTEDPIRPEPSA